MRIRTIERRMVGESRWSDIRGWESCWKPENRTCDVDGSLSVALPRVKLAFGADLVGGNTSRRWILSGYNERVRMKGLRGA